MTFASKGGLPIFTDAALRTKTLDVVAMHTITIALPSHDSRSSRGLIETTVENALTLKH